MAISGLNQYTFKNCLTISDVKFNTRNTFLIAYNSSNIKMRIKVPYFVPWITKNDKKAILDSLNQRWLTNGPILQKFEKSFSKFIGSKYAMGVSTATHGLHLSLKILGIGHGDEVIVPTMTFAATSDAVRYCGGTPILADVDSDTFNILPADIEKKITKKTKAIIPVHYGGQACDMNQILSIARKHNLTIIEDCAHALGSMYGKLKCGNIGNAGCFSFYPTKIITTGEGGMITTNNAKFFQICKLLRSHGMSSNFPEREVSAQWQYDITEMGYNYRLDEIRASLGYSQFKRIERINSMRIKLAKIYDKELSKIKGITIPKTKPDRNHIYHLYTIKINDDYHMTRNELFQKLHKYDIGASVQYTPLHKMTYNRKSYKNQRFPNADKLQDQILCLPIFPKMSIKQIMHVVSVLK